MVNDPKPKTVARYGLTIEAWRAILEGQGGVCAVCKKIPASGRMVTDHEHVKGWKKMPPDERRKYVRGVICNYCNYRRVGRGMSLEIARNVTAYLERYALSPWLPR